MSALKEPLAGRTVCSVGQRVGDVVLAQVVADAHLAAEAVAAVVDGHLLRVVRERMHQHGYVEAGETDRVGNCALVAEVRERDQDAVDLVTVLPEHLGAEPGLLQRFDGAIVGALRRG